MAPRLYVGKGRMVLFPPQFTEWTDFKTIEALVAAEHLKVPDTPPDFGVIGLKRDDLTALSMETGKPLPTGPITVAEARVSPTPFVPHWASGVHGLENYLEHIGPWAETSRVGDGANVRFARGGPQGTMAVGHLAPNDGGSERAFAGVVRCINQSGPAREGQKLIARWIWF